MSLVDDLNKDKATPLIMAILNVTPDSFSDGGRYNHADQLKYRISQLQAEGAHIIDVGGESTRPGAQAVSEQEELDRVLPALELVKSITGCYVSIDSYKPAVMKAALALGVDMVNDVNALQAEGAIELLACHDEVAICLMHKQGQPQSMQKAPSYQDVVVEVKGFLQQRIHACKQAGIDIERLVLDPGFGFGKTLAHNQSLFQRLTEFQDLARPLLVGVSRKTMIGQLLDDLPLDARGLPSVVAALLAVQQGAKLVRVHEVKETCQALTLAKALKPSQGT